VCFDFDHGHSEFDTVSKITSTAFDGDEKGGDGGASFDFKVFGNCTNGETTVTNDIYTGGVKGVDSDTVVIVD
jgi:hypothetical protein